MKSICKQSFLYSIGATAWIVLVAVFMQNANNLFGKVDTVITGVAALLLFSTSALIVGGLVVGKPIFMYIDGKKKEAVKMVIANGGWMLLYLVVVLITMWIRK